jgi:hypothetical protein
MKSLFTLAILCAGDIPNDGPRAHLYADGVLYPQLLATLNKWAIEHPTDKVKDSGDHVQTVNARDVANWRAVEEAFEVLRTARRRGERP